MVARHALLRGNVAKHVTLLLIGSSHAPLDALRAALLQNFGLFQQPARDSKDWTVIVPIIDGKPSRNLYSIVALLSILRGAGRTPDLPDPLRCLYTTTAFPDWKTSAPTHKPSIG